MKHYTILRRNTIIGTRRELEVENWTRADIDKPWYIIRQLYLLNVWNLPTLKHVIKIVLIFKFHEICKLISWTFEEMFFFNYQNVL